jgi:polyisoprenoid-binding protein YceI
LECSADSKAQDGAACQCSDVVMPLKSCRQRISATQFLKRCAPALAALGLGNIAMSAPVTWHSDPMGTSMELSFDHSRLIEVAALIKSVTAVAVIDDGDLRRSSLSFSADINNVLSYNERWTRDLRSAQLFDATATPEIRFESIGVARSGSGYRIRGNLTLHGVTRPQEFSMIMSKILPYKTRRFRGVTLIGQVDWRAFGMTYQDQPELRDYPEYGRVFTLKINCEFNDDQPKSLAPAAADDHGEAGGAAGAGSAAGGSPR